MMLLEEGRGGFMDSHKYRKVMTDMFWYGVVPEESTEDKAARSKAEAIEAKASIGKRATPKTALEEMRELQETIRAQGSAPE
ncbi:hypothetical protein [Gemmatimonas sp.]|uniref:hypothetical protein n=1 Tax=Gemmatimonas sp. TaxID=1962908 RepID=UPI003568DF8F